MEWKEVRLGDVCSIQRGASPRPIQKFISKEGMPWVKIADATGISSRYISSTSEYIIKEGISKSRIVHPGDLIVSNSATPGLPKFMAIEACVHDGWLIIRDLDGIDKVFLYYVFINIRRRLSNQANGSVFMNLKTDIVKDFVIKLPTLDDQRRIASILSSLDQKIELNNKINADLEEMAQAIFKNWFVDFEPFKDGKFVDSELGMVPEGWKVGTLGDMGTIVCGKTPSKANSNYYGGDIPFIKIPDMHGNVFVESSEDRLTEQGSLSQIKKIIPPYSLMVSCIATVGLVSINTKPSHTNQQINTIIPHNKSALFYLYQYIKNNEELLKNMGRGGTTTLNVNTKSFSNIRLFIPSDIALLQFHQIVEGLFKKIELNMQESRTLALLRDTLLPRLMSGEIEVPE